jgi:WD40 repeat protein
MKTVIALSCLIFILTACNSATPTSTATAVLSPVPVKQPSAIFTKAPLEPPVQHPRPTSTPRPTATPLPVTSLAEKGNLFVWDNQAKRYEIFDLSTGNLSRVIRWKPECEWELLPHATVTVCENQSGQQYLLDVLKGSTQNLPIWNARLIGWDPNGRFLVFTQGTADSLDIFSYDIPANVTRTLALDIDRQEQNQWLTQPVLSADGQKLIVVRGISDQPNTSVFEIAKIGAQFRQIGLSEPPATWDVAWSPVANQFVYGATDIEQEIGPSPNYLFLVNIQNGEIRELAKSPQPVFFWFWSLEWSPTGKQIAVGLWDLAFKTESQACVINLDNTNPVCHSAQRSINGKFLAWSPTGEHIAFVDTAANLIASDPTGTNAVKLLENVPEDFLLVWR